MKLSLGWFDLGTFMGDPGLEHKEDLESVVKTAAAGGFTSWPFYPIQRPVSRRKMKSAIS